MRKLIPLFALSLLACALLRATPADTAFETAAKAFIEDYLRLNPEAATSLGDHRHDGKLTEYSREATAARIETWRKHLAALEKIDAKQLTGPNKIDVRIMRVALESMLFNLTEEKSREWNPAAYNASLSNSIYQLTSRDFAPAEARLKSAAQRLAAIPTVVAQIKATLRNPPRVHTETAIGQTGGGIAFVRTGLSELLEKAPGMKAELAPLQEKAAAALEDYKRWLEKDVLPAANGEFRLGADRFRKKLRLALDSDLTPEQLYARCEEELEKTTDELYATAWPLYVKFFGGGSGAGPGPQAPGAPSPLTMTREQREEGLNRTIRGVLDKLAEKRANDDTVVDRCKELVRDATVFVRAKNFVTVPDTPLKVIVLPEFQRGVAVAYCQPPGALEPGGETFFAVSPTPKDWTDARRLSFYREYNDYMLHDLTVHEAMPGHYLQLAHANTFKAPTLIRAMFFSGTFTEGWAVYAERLMAEAGFGGPEVKMQQLKMRLRAIINAMIDQGVHAKGMTEQEAMELMLKRGFQEEGEAAGKWRRVVQSSAQLSTYFVGAVEHDDMRAAAEKKLGASFNLKAYHDKVLSFGSPAVKYVREETGW